jgi:hypothetical protein
MVVLLALLSLLLATPGPAAAQPAVEPVEAAVDLSYDRPLGQVALYRLSLTASGTEVSLDETIPVRWEAVVEIREEVIAKGTDGALWLRVQTQPKEIKDKAGTLGGGLPARWPVLQVRATRRGEFIEVAPAIGEPDESVRARSLVALLGQPSPVILPEAPVRPGETWEYTSGSARQTSRLVRVSEADGERIAHISTTGSFPLALAESSEALGLTTQAQGEGQQRSDTELLMGSGLVKRQTGETRLLTKSEVVLKLPEGDTVYRMDSDITVTFDLRLVEVDGRRVADS